MLTWSGSTTSSSPASPDTTISDTFTYDVARWLAQRYPQQLSVEWDFEEQGRQMAVTLPLFVPLLADDSLVEADTPFLDWMASAADSPEKILPWLLQRVADMPVSSLEKTSLYDSLRVKGAVEAGRFFGQPDALSAKSLADVLPPAAATSSQPDIAGRRDEFAAAAGPQAFAPRRRRSAGSDAHGSDPPLSRTVRHHSRRREGWFSRRRSDAVCRFFFGDCRPTGVCRYAPIMPA